MQKIVSQLDAAGYLVGPVVADESPLEPGVYLVPGGCVDQVPPAVPQGMRARWILGAWQFEAASVEPDPEPAPESIEAWRARIEVSAFQAQAALLAAGLLGQVEALMANPATDPLARLAWVKAGVFRRMSPTVLAMAQPLGLSELQLDDLFRHALTIQA